MTTPAILCFIERDRKFLMQKKNKSKFGGGKWNAPGGKILKDETPEECAVREVFEETGLKVRNLRHQGLLNFTVEGKPLMLVHVFSARDFEGRIKPNCEGELKWMKKDSLPYDSMWADDRHWMRLFIDEKEFEGDFDFKENLKSIKAFSLREA